MIIKKILETYVDITNPNDIFCHNRNEMILDKLRDKYIGRCYNSCYILQVNKIIRRSYFHMKDTLEGDSYISVLFEVDAIIYQMNEIINGCKIIKKEQNGIVHAKSVHAGIQLNIHQNMSIFKEGDVLPVIVKKVRYNINQIAISILAMPFIPLDNTPIYYKINGSPTKEEIDNINSLIKQTTDIENQINGLNSNDKKIYKFFVELLSNTKKSTDYKNFKKVHVSKILEIAEYHDGVVYQPSNIYDDAFIYCANTNEESLLASITSSDKKNTQSQKMIIDESAYNVISQFLIQYLCHLQSLQDFIKQYPNFSAVEQNKSVWKMYSMLKK